MNPTNLMNLLTFLPAESANNTETSSAHRDAQTAQEKNGENGVISRTQAGLVGRNACDDQNHWWRSGTTKEPLRSVAEFFTSVARRFAVVESNKTEQIAVLSHKEQQRASADNNRIQRTAH